MAYVRIAIATHTSDLIEVEIRSSNGITIGYSGLLPISKYYPLSIESQSCTYTIKNNVIFIKPKYGKPGEILLSFNMEEIMEDFLLPYKKSYMEKKYNMGDFDICYKMCIQKIADDHYHGYHEINGFVMDDTIINNSQRKCNPTDYTMCLVVCKYIFICVDSEYKIETDIEQVINNGPLMKIGEIAYILGSASETVKSASMT